MQCFAGSAWASQCAGPLRRSSSPSSSTGRETGISRQMVDAGVGASDYVEETAFKYVGSGEGDVQIVDEPPSPTDGKDRRMLSSCLRQVRLAECSLGDMRVCRAVLGVLLIVGLLVVVIIGLPARESAKDNTVSEPDVISDSKSQDCLTQAVKAAVTGTVLEPGQKSFSITLDRSKSGWLGVQLHSEPGALAVGSVGKDLENHGLVGAWNKAHPDMAVQTGDRVIAIGGASGKSGHLLRKLNSDHDKSLKLKILRAPCDANPVSKVPPSSEAAADQKPSRDKNEQSSKIKHAIWTCHVWTRLEAHMVGFLHRTRESVCSRPRDDDYEYKFTYGDATAAPGCSCWCCRRRKVESLNHDGPKRYTFRPGLHQYDGLEMRLLSAHADSVRNPSVIVLNSAANTPTNVLLLRFADIVGDGAKQILPGSRVTKANLMFNVINPGGGLEVHRMISVWNSSTTFDQLMGHGVNAIQSDETLMDVVPKIDTGVLTLDLVAAAKHWASGKPNFGIALVPIDQNGIELAGLHTITPPMLEVEVDGVNIDPSKAIPLETTPPPKSSTTSAPHNTPQTTGNSDHDLVVKNTKDRGLTVEFFLGVDPHSANWKRLSQMDPDLVKIVPNADCFHGSPCWDGVPNDKPLAAVWRGALLVEKSGVYSFDIRSDSQVDLIIGGHMILGRQNGATPGSLFQPPSRIPPQKLKAGRHAIRIFLLELDTRGILALKCSYQGPDTGGIMKPIPKPALAPAEVNLRRRDRLERKFGAELAAAGASLRVVSAGSISAAGCLAAVILAACAAVSFFPAIVAIVAVGSQWVDKVRMRSRTRSLRQYDPLSALVGGVATAE